MKDHIKNFTKDIQAIVVCRYWDAYVFLIFKIKVVQNLSQKNISLCFHGYGPIHKRYCCLEPKTKRVYISKYVVFDEEAFPFKPS